MSDLRRSIDDARRVYRSQTYGGDLGGLVGGPAKTVEAAPRTRTTRAILVWAAAAAAAVVVAWPWAAPQRADQQAGADLPANATPSDVSEPARGQSGAEAGVARPADRTLWASVTRSALRSFDPVDWRPGRSDAWQLLPAKLNGPLDLPRNAGQAAYATKHRTAPRRTPNAAATSTPTLSQPRGKRPKAARLETATVTANQPAGLTPLATPRLGRPQAGLSLSRRSHRYGV